MSTNPERTKTSFVVYLVGKPEPHIVVAESLMEVAAHIPRLAEKEGKCGGVRLGDPFQVKIGLVSKAINICHSSAYIGKNEQVDFTTIWS